MSLEPATVFCRTDVRLPQPALARLVVITSLPLPHALSFQLNVCSFISICMYWWHTSPAHSIDLTNHYAFFVYIAFGNSFVVVVYFKCIVYYLFGQKVVNL